MIEEQEEYLVLLSDDEWELLGIGVEVDVKVDSSTLEKTAPARSAQPHVSRPKRLLMPRLLFAVGCASAVCFVGFLILGWEYYSLSIMNRPFHPYHDLLRSSGILGLSTGIVGLSIMTLNLSYLVRKRLIGYAWLGSLRSWMSFHVLTGLVGPGFIILHSGLRPVSSIGSLAFGAMLIVVVAGIIGRYIYAQVPRSLEGRELELAEVRTRLHAYQNRLVALGVDVSILVSDDEKNSAVTRGFFAALWTVLVGDQKSRHEYRVLTRLVRESIESRAAAYELLPLVRGLCREKRWLSRYQELRSLMGSWRFLHRWLALAMLLLALFHIGIAVSFGDLWIFGGNG